MRLDRSVKPVITTFARKTRHRPVKLRLGVFLAVVQEFYLRIVERGVVLAVDTVPIPDERLHERPEATDHFLM